MTTFDLFFLGIPLAAVLYILSLFRDIKEKDKGKEKRKQKILICVAIYGVVAGFSVLGAVSYQWPSDIFGIHPPVTIDAAQLPFDMHAGEPGDEAGDEAEDENSDEAPGDKAEDLEGTAEDSGVAAGNSNGAAGNSNGAAGSSKVASGNSEGTDKNSEGTGGNLKNDDAVIIPQPNTFIMCEDDGAPENAFQDMALMGMSSNGNDGSISMNNADKGVKAKVGSASLKFTYMPVNPAEHWSGVALLWEPGIWNARGPDLKEYSQLTFWVYGSGGQVKFFLEGNGDNKKQTAKVVTLKEEWQKVALSTGNWDYINIPFGWTCNQSDLLAAGNPVTFWVDGLQFE
ncbi:MAG: hypothetical protein FWG42_01275 [Clostridiales bacterium]|nr:hypothetical protein [Clostridiales bacterium]